MLRTYQKIKQKDREIGEIRSVQEIQHQNVQKEHKNSRGNKATFK